MVVVLKNLSKVLKVISKGGKEPVVEHFSEVEYNRVYSASFYQYVAVLEGFKNLALVDGI